ncbi:potassium channel family protein [Clostridium perfringens]|nr:potassium channel family protein [Clostridium perfringens]
MVNKKIYSYYDLLIGILSILMILILITENTLELSNLSKNMFILIDKLIWFIFVIDYFTRFIISNNKLEFFKKNLIDLISIIPFNSIFAALRIIRIAKAIKIIKLIKIFRASILLIKFKNRLGNFFKTNNFNYVVYLTILTILIGAITISLVEKMSFPDALWWSFVTTTTVGYGDLSPSTTIGRLIAVMLMLTGIGFLGMLTGTISSFFLKESKVENLTYKESLVEDIRNRLKDFENLNKDELEDMFKVLKGLKDL